MLWPTGRRWCAADAVVLLAVASWLCGVWAEEKIIFDRHAVYWNSSNPKPQRIELRAPGGGGGGGGGGGAASYRREDSNMADMSVEQIAMKADALTDESLESTRRMRMMAEETKETGGKTMVMLDEQGEQLKRAEEGMDQINQDMRQAEKNLKDLSKCCGLCVCPCDRVTSIENDSRYKRTWGIGGEGGGGGGGGRGSVVSRQPSGVRNGGAAQTQASPPSGPYVKRITNDAREDEMEENLGAVGDIIGNLKTMAMDMGGELDKQNKQIDRLTDKAEVTKSRVDEANQRATKLIS
ncbi:unnamed protein product [Boreogadus saida]